MFQGKELLKGHIERFEKALATISNYTIKEYDYIIDQILNISKQFTQQNKMRIVGFLHKICKSEEEFLLIAKELGDVQTIIDHYNSKLKVINKRIEDGFRKIG
jgi:ATP-dependent DNA helicase RecQ